MQRRELHIADETVRVTLAVFKNVANAEELLRAYNEKTIGGDPDMRRFFLLLDGQLIFSDNHILHSLYRAYHNLLTKRRVTRNVVLEVFFFLSAHENINECLRQYQVRESSSSVIYVGVNIPDDEVISFTNLINGEQTGVDDIRFLRDERQIMQNFKCAGEVANLERFIYHTIASKKVNLG
ncbi:EKC/KEOPS complex subunit CGI121, putative [Plasmodium vivax]|uniref:EKC/KEOPS complex subunit CGI121 n=6 Tax=Plasmodium vivax TaxID=5855 RepID=A5K9P0_PLAVS|nr:hypothetical protein, conserved [Plasmodium vivax]KMZ80017.1 hypothetical protein PVIIG_06473 [Plasmodium vivax India VII]KMZ86341.1 hypothetical protein PVBG_01864 [Plasmodium vivax Brazil I]KMZ92702.1 hypothetical protein PVMG_01290 [Plasmodium vivax Mauritania I]KMZ99051.1 hypothetical protein PVNG_06503 [Plasmodium vivax North Korean]EDL44112.1 hypothetical protein, conserved [Plasmodium vivax]|eukprot:XP_001613839.1 hypothetical protein [Plasmodium vivax Sal-1]